MLNSASFMIVALTFSNLVLLFLIQIFLIKNFYILKIWKILLMTLLLQFIFLSSWNFFFNYSFFNDSFSYENLNKDLLNFICFRYLFLFFYLFYKLFDFTHFKCTFYILWIYCKGIFQFCNFRYFWIEKIPVFVKRVNWGIVFFY